MNQECVDFGGKQGMFCAANNLLVEQECQLGSACTDALHLWQVRCGEVVTLKNSVDLWCRAAQQVTVLPVILGLRILRTEIAVIVAAALAPLLVGDYV
jgi:hypothetical protein